MELSMELEAGIFQIWMRSKDSILGYSNFGPLYWYPTLIMYWLSPTIGFLSSPNWDLTIKQLDLTKKFYTRVCP